jgi:hypothetical protein
MSHRVFAVEGGAVHYTRHGEMSLNCNDRHFQISHFSYWHVSPEWADGTYVHAGEMIGWTCLNEWHVHLSEWALVNGQRAWVNPLHAGGKLQPYVDEVKPVIRAISAFGPPAQSWSPQGSAALAATDGAQSLVLGNLHGAVDLRAWIDDSQGGVGLYRADHQLAADLSPYRIWVRIRRVADGTIVWQRTVYLCVHAIGGCVGRLFYHLVVSDDRYLWDTRSVRDGAYELTVRAYDISGNMDERRMPLTVRN